MGGWLNVESTVTIERAPNLVCWFLACSKVIEIVLYKVFPGRKTLNADVPLWIDLVVDGRNYVIKT